MSIATIKSQAEVVRNMVKRLRGLETSFTDSWGQRKTHFLLTYTPKEVPVAREEYALGARQAVELFTEINELLDIIKKIPLRRSAKKERSAEEMKGCEDCKHYCGTTYVVDHDEYGEVRETSQCARHVLATGKCKDYEPSDKAAPAPKSLAPTETVRDILDRMEAGYIPPHKRDEEITALYAKLLKRALIREGNPVALRKVLLDAKNRLETFARHDRDWRWCLEHDIRAISAALATPPRNCDVVLIENLAKRNIADIVWAAFRETHPKAYLDVPGLLLCINWLFAKAEEAPHA